MEAILESKTPRRLRITPTAKHYLQLDAGAGWIGLLLPWDSDHTVPVSALREIELSRRTIDGESFVAIGTHTTALFHECYAFLLTLSQAVESGARTPFEALKSELSSWATLLTAAARLTREHEIGLVGELWALHRLVGILGPKAVAAWVAIDPESHDFRFAGVDLEVKTTIANERIHSVSNLSQMVPLTDHSLYFLSIQIAPCGPESGLTLPEMIEELRTHVRHEPQALHDFDRALANRGYRDGDGPQYQTRFKLRGPAALVPVDGMFPAITRADIAGLLGSAKAARVSDLRYRVSLQDLGSLDGSKEFYNVLPRSPLGGFL
ncbi:MAG: PD-(D/E)XK motif protein [Gemmatimonadales bacterium]|nr:PD-(D/E)XK motif protein [Gemmatimonadales bacterium]